MYTDKKEILDDVKQIVLTGNHQEISSLENELEKMSHIESAEVYFSVRLLCFSLVAVCVSDVCLFLDYDFINMLMRRVDSLEPEESVVQQDQGGSKAKMDLLVGSNFRIVP